MVNASQDDTTTPPTLGDKISDAMNTIRWLLLPINVGLTLALVMYVIRFLVEDVHLFFHSFSQDTEQLLIPILGLADMAMVANLLVMLIQGGHQIFIQRLNAPGDIRAPWLDHIDSGLLKLKVSLSIAGITLVRMLKDFIEIEHVDWTVVIHRMEIHCLALVSALIMAVIWRLTHSESNASKHKEHT